MKIKIERAALEWDYFVLQEQLKSLMYVDRLLHGDPNKDNFTGELKLKSCILFKRNTISKFFVGVTVKGRKFIIHEEYFDAKNIFSHQFLQNLKHRPNMVQHLSKKTKKALKK